MKKKVMFPIMGLAILSIFTSCDSNVTEASDNIIETTLNNNQLAEKDAQQSFAKILSRVAQNNQNVRQFLKIEAQKQYDKDVSTKGYEMYSLTSGSVDVVIAPTRIR